MDITTTQPGRPTAAMCNMTARAVPKRGSRVVPDRIFQTVVKGKPDRFASATTCACDSFLSAARTCAGVGMAAVMPPNVPLAVYAGQPQSVFNRRHSAFMAFIDPSTILWANICALMGYGPNDKAPSIDTVQRRVGVGRGTVQRIKDQSAATQLDSLITIAAKLGVPVWKLLQPASEVTAPAVASLRALAVAALFDQLSPRDMQAVEALATNLQPEDATPARVEPSAAPIPSREHAG